MSEWLRSKTELLRSNRIFSGDSHSSTTSVNLKASKKPSSKNDICYNIFKDKTIPNFKTDPPTDIDCVEECKKEESNKDNDIITQCLNKKGGKQKSKKYRNKKKNLTKRKRSYSSKKT